MAVWRSLSTVLAVFFLVGGCSTSEPTAPPVQSTERPLVFSGGPELIQPFLGRWEGTTTSGSERQRTLAVLVEGGDENTFSVTWRNWEATEETAETAEPVTIRQARLAFVPTEDPAVFAWADNPPPESDEARATAQLTPDRLVVHVTAQTEDGRQERQTYIRQIDGDRMLLDYTRWVDDEIRRVLQARLMRTMGG